MQPRNTTLLLAGIALLALFAAWIDLPESKPDWFNRLLFWMPERDRAIRIHEGLDLQGGLQVLLEARQGDVPVTARMMESARGIVENRVNGLGVAEPLIQIQGENRLIVELPGLRDPAAAIATLGRTGLLEFIDAGDTYLPPGTVVTTSLGGPASVSGGNTPTPEVATPSPTVTAAPPSPTATTTITTTGEITPTEPITPTIPVAQPKVYKTVLTGRQLDSADVGFDQLGRPSIQFKLRDDGPQIFRDFTTANVKKYLAIALDKTILSCPIINTPITDGSGVIEGNFTIQEARDLVVVLKYGALPVALDVVENRTIGPTLGQDSVRKSVIAGAIGLLVVVVFMLLYYRLPGFLADVALVIYSLVVFALFKLIPVTLTLAGIAGFILSIGMAVDANILIFERMREELRAGKTLGAAIEAGFDRAWTSIRDSNFSTLITCAILFWFGLNFGASIVRGFALTLAIGVIVSMFTAITVTRTFLRALVGTGLSEKAWLFGLPEDVGNLGKGA